MRRSIRTWSHLLAAALVTGLVACGGSDTVTNNPTPSPTPPPAPEIVSQQQGFGIEVGVVSFANFATQRSGTVEAVVDWTFPANDLDVYVTPATCSFEQLIADQCSVLGFSESVTAKPERVRITNVAAGNYILWVANAGPGDDRLSYQVILTANAVAAEAPTGEAASRARALHPEFDKGHPKDGRELH
jgi:hypothetical protein